MIISSALFNHKNFLTKLTEKQSLTEDACGYHVHGNTEASSDSNSIFHMQSGAAMDKFELYPCYQNKFRLTW